MATTIDAVADRAGVSPSTVSRALRDIPGISATTRKRVREAAEALGYVASPPARRLATGRTGTVSVIAPLLSKWFFAEVVAAAARVLSDAGYDVLLTELSTPSRREAFFAAPRLRGRSDGVIVIALQLTTAELAALREQGQQVALVGLEHPGASSVRVHDLEGGRSATRHLLNLGHERVAFLGIAEEPGSTLGGVPPTQRLVGYRAALAEAGIPSAPELEVTVENTVEAGAAGTAHLLTVAPPATALVAASDEIAFGALQTLRRSGVRVPRDFSVVGFDNHQLAEVVDLTTMDHAVPDQGTLAARALLRSLSGSATETGHIEPRLVVRGTTAPPHHLRVESP